MRYNMNNFDRMFAEDTGVVEAVGRKMERKVRPEMANTAGMQLRATAMLRMVAEDTGALELCDHRSYANTVSGRETLMERLVGFVADIRAERAARREMHSRMSAAFADAKRQAV